MSKRMKKKRSVRRTLAGRRAKRRKKMRWTLRPFSNVSCESVTGGGGDSGDSHPAGQAERSKAHKTDFA